MAAARSVEERCLWQFAFASGIRTGELIGLKWGHIDWLRSEVTISENVVRGEVGTVTKDTKTGIIRQVPLLPGALAALAAMKALTMLAGEYVFRPPGKKAVRWRDDNQIREKY